MAPINKHLETDLENVHSLPNIEEARTQNIMASGGNRYSGKKKRMIALIVVLVAVIAAAVGFTIAGTQNKRAREEANSLASNEDGEDEDDDEENDDGENDDVERFEQVKILLTQGGITSATEFQQTTSPQYKAAAWIANDDELEMDIPESIDEEDSYIFVQRYVMAVFYYALGGVGWKRDAAFLSGDDTCEWDFDLALKFAVPGSDISEFDYGVSCWDDDAGEYGDAVTWIFMPDNNLVGTLPSEIGALESLSHLSLFQNKIVGPIPESFRQLEFLNFWAMESNKIDGSLPSWIGEFEYLQYLALGNNSLSGELPSFINSNLLELSLDSNMFTGSIDSLNDATSLTSVYLNNNDFSGEITEGTWEDLTELSVADLSSNKKLIGTFPVSFYWLEEIDMSNTGLTSIAAPLSDEDVDFPVTLIKLANSDLKGKIPSNIDELVSLVSFDVSGNSLTGEIPTQFGNLENLESLYLSNNPTLAAGDIPDLRGCQFLTEVSMSNTERTGIIPDWFGNALSDLQILDLANNQLEKTIPANLGSLDDLWVLFLNRNMLMGTVPSELGDLVELEYLTLDNNQLSGDMTPICDGDDEDLIFLTADTVVQNCGDGCCSEYCEDANCNLPNGTLIESDYQISRESYVYGEDLSLADSPEE